MTIFTGLIAGWCRGSTTALVGSAMVLVLSTAILAAPPLPKGGQKVVPGSTKEKPAEARPYDLVYMRGRVVFLAEVLQRRFDVHSVPEAQQRELALETPAGRVYPLVMDVRGRAFGVDKRLREMDLVLMARRYHGLTMLQVIRVYSERRKIISEVDYWCEICAIAMYELKPCDCCQGTIQLRQRRRKLNVNIE